MTRHVHTIPVPQGMTPGEAWAEITIMGKLTEPTDEATCRWAVVECDGDECADVQLSDAEGTA